MRTDFKVALGILLLAGLGRALLAQGSKPLGEGVTQETLVAEVRALRADVQQLAGAGIRTQWLVARLALQEQRVSTAARQLADARTALTAVQTRIQSERARVLQLDDAASRATPEALRSIQQSIAEAAGQIELQRREEQQLQARETELLRAVSDAQSLWTDLSARLDEIEKTFTVRAQQ